MVVGRESDRTPMHFGIVESIWGATTLESGLKIVSAQAVSPGSEEELIQLVPVGEGQHVLRSALKSAQSLVSLGPVTSTRLVEGLARSEVNWPAMRAVERGVAPRRVYAGPSDLQADAVATALRVFGVSLDDAAESLDVADPGESTLDQIRISEDSVIEHDARVVEGFKLADSDLKGRAVFVKGGEMLNVITANRRPLEELMGVDLIYVNEPMGNVVMVQYKMLEQVDQTRTTDWIFWPDAQFREEARRMRRWVAGERSRGRGEYRINNEVFYLKFVKRDATLGRAPIVIPMAHFEELEKDPSSRGPRGGFRVSFDALGGRYLRQASFLELIRSGYIGADSRAASAYARLIEAVLHGGRGIVAALQAKCG